MSAPSTGPRSPTNAGVYGQHDFAVRFDWGPDGADAVVPGVDAVVVVDVLSFTTAVSVATAKGALIFPYPWEDGAAEFAASKHADLAGPVARAVSRSLPSLSRACSETTGSCCVRRTGPRSVGRSPEPEFG